MNYDDDPIRFVEIGPGKYSTVPRPVVSVECTPNMLRVLADALGPADIVTVHLTRRQEEAIYALGHSQTEQH